MHKIGDLVKLHIDDGSDLGVRGSVEGWGVPQAGVESKPGEGLYTLCLATIL